MKNLTVKKIALGLFLAGYAASSAFALTAKTEGVINGNKPVMKSKKDDAGEHTMTAKILGKDSGQPIKRAAKVGDTISISYKLVDADGDTDGNLNLHKTLKVYTKANSSSPWVERTRDIAVTATPVAGENKDEGEFHFEIPSTFAGVEIIGYVLQERTDYGIPYEGEWLSVSNIWDRAHSPGHQSANPGDPGSDTGPGDGEGTGTGPVESNATKIGIFLVKNGVVDKSVNYEKASVPPAYGQQFVAIVWDEAGTENHVPDGAETIRTSSYKFKWQLVGTYTPQGGSSGVKAGEIPSGETLPTSAELTQGVTTSVGTNDQIYLGSSVNTIKHNSLYTAVSSTYLAGAQGYNLKVTTY